MFGLGRMYDDLTTALNKPVDLVTTEELEHESNKERTRTFRSRMKEDERLIYELAKIDNIIGVKDSTGDMTNTAEYIRLTRHNDNFHVLMGRDTLIYAALCCEASGAIASCANVAPRITADI